MVFRVGQKVMCVNDTAGPGFRWEDGESPVVGQLYTMRRYLVDEEGDSIIHLDEIRRGSRARLLYGDEVGYGVRRFRPVVSTDTGMAILEQIRRDVSNKILRPIFEDEQA